MKKTFLTYRTISFFETNYRLINSKDEKEVELCAYIANIGHQEWSDSDIFIEFLRNLKISKVQIEKI